MAGDFRCFCLANLKQMLLNMCYLRHCFDAVCDKVTVHCNMIWSLIAILVGPGGKKYHPKIHETSPGHFAIDYVPTHPGIHFGSYLGLAFFLHNGTKVCLLASHCCLRKLIRTRFVIRFCVKPTERWLSQATTQSTWSISTIQCRTVHSWRRPGTARPSPSTISSQPSSTIRAHLMVSDGTCCFLSDAFLARSSDGNSVVLAGERIDCK